MPIMTEGAEEAERVGEEIKASRPAYYRVKQLPIKPGEQYVVHFVTEINRLRSFDTHSYMPTKPKPDGYKGDRWLEKMWGICRQDRAFRLRDPQNPKKLLDQFEDGYGDCYLHDAFAGVKDEKYGHDMSRPTWMTYGLAVLRKPVEDPVTGAITGFADEMAEYAAEDGAKYRIPQFVYLSQRYEKFWAQAKAAAWISQTILDGDFLLSRKENEYNVALAVPTPQLKPGTEAWQGYEKALDLIGFDLDKFLLDHASADHYAYWFDPSKTPEGGYNRRRNGEAETEETTSVGTATAGTQPVNQDLLAGFQASLRNRGTQS